MTPFSVPSPKTVLLNFKLCVAGEPKAEAKGPRWVGSGRTGSWYQPGAVAAPGGAAPGASVAWGVGDKRCLPCGKLTAVAPPSSDTSLSSLLGKARGFFKSGDLVIVLTGWRPGSGYTNTMRVVPVP